MVMEYESTVGQVGGKVGRQLTGYCHAQKDDSLAHLAAQHSVRKSRVPWRLSVLQRARSAGEKLEALLRSSSRTRALERRGGRSTLEQVLASGKIHHCTYDISSQFVQPSE